MTRNLYGKINLAGRQVKARAITILREGQWESELVKEWIQQMYIPNPLL